MEEKSGLEIKIIPIVKTVSLLPPLQASKVSSSNSVQFSRSVVPDSLWPHGLQLAKFPCPSPTPRACSKPCPSSQWCPFLTTPQNEQYPLPIKAKGWKYSSVPLLWVKSYLSIKNHVVNRTLAKYRSIPIGEGRTQFQNWIEQNISLHWQSYKIVLNLGTIWFSQD